MKRRQFTVAVSTAGATAGAMGWAASAHAALGQTDAAAGIRAALERGAEAAVSVLAKPDGFLGNAKVRIPLPGFLADAAKLLKATGQQKKVDELVTAMNRAAEAAVPQAKALLVQAVKSMSLDDALMIVRGPDNSLTEFFARKTRQPLGVQFLPIISRATEHVALADKYNAVAGKAAKLGLMKGEDADLNRYVTGKSLDGLYLMISEEERRIRKDPFGTGSEILKKVFGR